MADEFLTNLVKRFDDALDARAPAVETYQRYYEGRARLRYATAKFQEAFGNMLGELSNNWCSLVVRSSVERLHVSGFRFGVQATSDAEVEDDAAWALWQANYLDADSELAHSTACMTGTAYVLVTPVLDGVPRITVESPLEAITMTAPTDRRLRMAGYKRWQEDDGASRAVLYMPEAFYVLARNSNGGAWEQLGPAVPNPTGIVPLVPMLNMPELTESGVAGVSDLQPVLPLQDAINKLLADMLVNSEFVAFPQRWVTGVEIPLDDAGEPLPREQFMSAVDRLWVAEEPDANFGSLPGDDGKGYVSQMDALKQDLAAITSTPPHYLTAGLGQWPSGESLTATESGLVAKVKRKQITFGEAWEEAMRLGFLFMGDETRGNATQAEVIWTDPERRQEGELVDALVKMRTLSVPLEVLWERWGASPQEIDLWRRQRGLPDNAAGEPTSPSPPPEQVPRPEEG